MTSFAKQKTASPQAAASHCDWMRQKKAGYSLDAIKFAYSSVTGKSWSSSCSAHFGIEDTAVAWATAGLMGEGFQRVKDHMLEVIKAGGSRRAYDFLLERNAASIGDIVRVVGLAGGRA